LYILIDFVTQQYFETVIEQRGKSSTIRKDNGPEFTSGDFESWCTQKQITIKVEWMDE